MIEQEKKGKRRVKYRLEGFMDIKQKKDPLLSNSQKWNSRIHPYSTVHSKSKLDYKPDQVLELETKAPPLIQQSDQTIRNKKVSIVANHSNSRKDLKTHFHPIEVSDSLKSSRRSLTHRKRKNSIPKNETFYSECLNQTYGKANLRRNLHLNYTSFAVNDTIHKDDYIPDGSSSLNFPRKPKKPKATNLTFCISGQGPNSHQLVHFAKQFTLKKVGSLFLSSTDKDSVMESIRLYFDELICACIDSTIDILYSGISVCFTLLFDGHLYYGNIGNNTILLIGENEEGMPILKKMDSVVHSMSNEQEAKRMKTACKEVRVESDFRFRLGVGNSKIQVVDFETTRCVGMMAGIAFGILDKPGTCELN